MRKLSTVYKGRPEKIFMPFCMGFKASIQYKNPARYHILLLPCKGEKGKNAYKTDNVYFLVNARTFILISISLNFAKILKIINQKLASFVKLN